MNWIITLIKDLYNAKFFGEIIIKFNNGTPVHVEKRTSIKPQDLG